MNKTTIKMILAVMVTGLLASGVNAAPIQLNDAQLDGIAAGGVEKVEGFVCPVIKGAGILNNPHDKAHEIGDTGYYTVVGPNVSVPMHATNREGAGFPSGDSSTFDKPGDIGYTAVWGFRP